MHLVCLFFWSTTHTDSLGISFCTVNGGVSSFVDGNVFAFHLSGSICNFSELINGRVAQPTLKAGKTKAVLTTVTTQFH